MTLTDFLPTQETAAAWTAVGELAESVAAGRRMESGLLYLHGPPGSGKTHLAQGLYHAAIDAERTAAITPTADIARLPDEPHGDRSIDVWILEDLQHLAERGAASLDRILELRLRRRLATLITANAGPGRLNLPPRLRNRVAGGLIVGLALPGPASRRHLLQHLAPPGLRVQPLALDWLAGRLSGVRALHGAMQKLIGLAANSKMPLDRATVQRHWSAEPDAGAPDFETILEKVADYFHFDAKVLRINDRRPNRTWPTQVVLALARQLTGCSAAAVGRWFDDREGRTVLYACKAVEERIAKDATAATDWRQLLSQFGVSAK